MSVDASRLRRGEWIVAASTVVLLACMFVLPWYGPTAAGRREGLTESLDGFHGLTHLRWLILITLAFALALVFLQATRRAPALPVSFSVFVTVLAIPTALWLIYRVVINVPTEDGLQEQRPTAYLGLAASLALTYGAYRSMRQEDRPDPKRNAAIETVAPGRSS